MPQKKRLPRAEFKANGYRTVKTPFFSLKMKSNGGDIARIGIVVGKNVHKTAVKRNFFKRHAREALRKTVSRGKDAIIILFPRVKELTKDQFYKQISQAVREAGRGL